MADILVKVTCWVRVLPKVRQIVVNEVYNVVNDLVTQDPRRLSWCRNKEAKHLSGWWPAINEVELQLTHLDGKTRQLASLPSGTCINTVLVRFVDYKIR